MNTLVKCHPHIDSCISYIDTSPDNKSVISNSTDGSLPLASLTVDNAADKDYVPSVETLRCR